MPLTPEDNQFLKGLFQYLHEKPLEPGDPRYVPLYESQPDGDPVGRLAREIHYSESDSRQFFSGFRGSGKSTQLLRLKKKLDEEGYRVYYADALEYLNPALPIEIGQLLMLLAGAFSDAVQREEGFSLAGESYWTRLKNFASANVELDSVELGLFSDVAKLKLAIRDGDSFRQKLQKALTLRPYEIDAQVKRFFEDYVKKLREIHPGAAGIVFLFDNLEQLRGSLASEREVIGSVQTLFSTHIERLAIPYVHVVYTVPPWLKLLMSAAPVEILPSITQWKKEDRSPVGKGNGCLREVIEGRFGQEGFVRFFGDDARADELVKVCGGNLRDLIQLLRQAILRVGSLPIPEQDIQASIRAVRNHFLPLSTKDALWLAEIAEKRDAVYEDSDPETIARISLYLDSHHVLFLRNGDDWYDVHPLIREYVAEIAAGEAKKAEKREAEKASSE
jgi:hypothetical protein